jgi:hypothetical protein
VAKVKQMAVATSQRSLDVIKDWLSTALSGLAVAEVVSLILLCASLSLGGKFTLRVGRRSLV